ncbi:MAG TPA: hypothetical protein VMB81_09275 [Candidatus Sulfotelmatobacter sp.]|nr:hypothetical protein [Candidatus Sulfotelmatobacter sp.]
MNLPATPASHDCGVEVSVWVIPTDEDLMIVRHAVALVNGTTADNREEVA